MKILDRKATESIMDMTKWDGHFIRPIDSLTFDESGAIKARDYWKKFLRDPTIANTDSVLADVLIGGVIPVYDILLETNMPKKRGDVLYGRIMIFSDLKERINDLTGELYVGALMLYTEFYKVIKPFKVGVGKEHIIFPDELGFISQHGMEDEADFYANNSDMIDISMIEDATKFYMELWYGVIWLILNPITVDVIREGKMYNRDKEASDSSDRVYKYIKYRVITSETFEYIERETPYHYHLDCWVVTGHWKTVHTKEGTKKKFINPYWKGPMRKLKNHMTRQREVTYGEEMDLNATEVH